MTSVYAEYCPLFIAASFILARNWKEPWCPSTEEWILKMWYIYTVEYNATIKYNELMKFADKWMELEHIIRSGITQTQNNACGMYSLVEWRVSLHARSQFIWIITLYTKIWNITISRLKIFPRSAKLLKIFKLTVIIQPKYETNFYS